jgi:hypothetical protein
MINKKTNYEETMKKLNQYNLYTFNTGKFCSTETETIEQAIYNFNNRVNLDPNGFYHPNMDYNFKPIRIITKQKITDEIELDRCNSETVLKFKLNELDHLILKNNN